MIDVHCHLEQKDYDRDRDEVIENCKKSLKAVITSCAHPRDFDLTVRLTEKYKDFAFASYGIHPEYIKEVSEKEIEDFLEVLSKNKEKITALGETGLDRFWIKEPEWQEKQRELFLRFVSLAKEMDKPLIVHSREASEDALKILEQEDAKKVLLHLWGDKNSVKRIIGNDWYISVGPILLRSKNHKKLIRDMPIERIMTETDSPWFGVEEKRGYPTNVKFVIEKIAEIKKVSKEYADKITTQNATSFFDLFM